VILQKKGMPIMASLFLLLLLQFNYVHFKNIGNDATFNFSGSEKD